MSKRLSNPVLAVVCTHNIYLPFRSSVLYLSKSSYLLPLFESSIRDETALVDLILVLGDRDDRCFSLLRHVQIEYLDLEHMNKFLDSVYPGHLDSISWRAVCKCVRDRFQEKPRSLPLAEASMRSVRPRFLFDESRPFSGIISHLASECGGNIHEKGVVNITGSGQAS